MKAVDRVTIIRALAKVGDPRNPKLFKRCEKATTAFRELLAENERLKQQPTLKRQHLHKRAKAARKAGLK